MSLSHQEPHTPPQDDSLPPYAPDLMLPAYSETIHDDLWEMQVNLALHQEWDLELGDIESEERRVHSRQTSLDFFTSPAVPAPAYWPSDPPPRYDGRHRQTVPAAHTPIPIELNTSHPAHAAPAPGIPSSAVTAIPTDTSRTRLESAAANPSTTADMLPSRYYWRRPEPPASMPEETPTASVDYVVLAAAAVPVPNLISSTRRLLGSRQGVIGRNWGVWKVFVGIGTLIAFVIILAVIDEKLRAPLRDAGLSKKRE